jgi:cytochrome c5
MKMKHPLVRLFPHFSIRRNGKISMFVLLCLVTSISLAMGSDGRGQRRPGSHPNPFTSGDVLATTSSAPQEAQTGFDGAPNGLVDGLVHQADQMAFEEEESADKGLGPVYNGTSCAECHGSPVTGGISQVTELRAGFQNRFGQFINPDVAVGDGTTIIKARSLINDRAVCPSAAFAANEVQEHVPDQANVRTFRTSLNSLGDGYVEAIADTTIVQMAVKQCKLSSQICGQVIAVPVLEAPGQTRVARFGWKNQHASLLSFSADAYLNEMGVTSPLQPQDITTLCKTTTDPEDATDDDGLADIDRFARFMRASKAPARDEALAATADAQLGADIFDRIGCDNCHVPTITTAPAGSVINGGAFVVPDALGNKTIHPYSDFLLHNVGTGDGIVQNGGPQTAQKLRTPPLWGVRLRSRMMHDGLSMTFQDAILRHGGEAIGVLHNYRNLTDQDRARLITFLKSL